MTTLMTPGETVEAAALAYAKQCVRYIHNESTRLTGNSWFTKAGGHALSRHVLKQYAMVSPFNMDEVISYATQGWGDAHEALGELISEFHGRGQMLLPQLAAYDIHAWRGRKSVLRGGRETADQISRNIAIVLVIKSVVEHFGLKATKSRKAKKPQQHRSASSLVAEALKTELPAGLFKPSDRAIEGMSETFGPKLLKFAALFRPALPLPPVPNLLPRTLGTAGP